MATHCQCEISEAARTLMLEVLGQDRVIGIGGWGVVKG